jgi:hypothetical protein
VEKEPEGDAEKSAPNPPAAAGCQHHRSQKEASHDNRMAGPDPQADKGDRVGQKGSGRHHSVSQRRIAEHHPGRPGGTAGEPEDQRFT